MKGYRMFKVAVAIALLLSAVGIPSAEANVIAKQQLVEMFERQLERPASRMLAKFAAWSVIKLLKDTPTPGIGLS